jgi:glycosyltransferase involved in cell wall biosynthesis
MSSAIHNQNSKRIAKNTAYLYVRMIILLAVGLYTSRVVLDALGIIDYGIYNVVGSIVSMFIFINWSMATATSRFLTYELGKSNDLYNERLAQVFSTSKVIHWGAALILLSLGEILGVWYVLDELVLPECRRTAALWLLQFSMFTAVIQIITIPYNSVIIARERMNAFAFISIYEGVMQLATAYIIKYLSTDKLIVYGALLMFIQVSVCAVYALYCHFNFKEVKSKLSFDKRLSKEMIKFAGWIMTEALAMVGYIQGLNIMLNGFFGPAVNAARGLAVNIQSKVTGFCQNFQIASIPQLTKSYAANDLSYMHTLIINSSKYSLYLMLWLSLPIILQTEYILNLWLVEVPEWTAVFIRWTLILGLIDTLRIPLNASVQATGNIKKYLLITSLLLILIVPCAWIWLYLGGKPDTIFMVQTIFFIITQIARISIVCPMIGLKKKTYFNKIIVEFLKVGIIGSIIPIATWLYAPIPNSTLRFITICIISLASVACAVYFIGLDKEMRDKINAKVFKFIYIMPKQNLLIIDFKPDNKWNLHTIMSDNHPTKLRRYVTNAPFFHRGIGNALRYICYFWIGFITALGAIRYNTIITWQQFHGITYAFFCRLLHLPKRSKCIILTFIYKPKEGKLGNLFRKFVKYSIDSKYIDKIIVYSSSECKFYSELLDVDINKFMFIPLGVEPIETVHSSRGNYIFSSGRSNRDYNFMINALAHKRYQVHIACAGFKPDDESDPNMEILHNCFGDKMLKQMAKSFCVVIPLQDEHISSGKLVILAAMQMGKPVIATRNDSINEYITDGETGFIIDKDADALVDAIERLYKDSNLYKRMSENSIHKFEQEFTLSSFGTRLSQLTTAL